MIWASLLLIIMFVHTSIAFHCLWVLQERVKASTFVLGRFLEAICLTLSNDVYENIIYFNRMDYRYRFDGTE